MLDTRLITFLTLLEEKNYTKTANKLYITQPAVTHHIKSLEKDNSIVLFKDNRTFELTVEGSLLRDYALAAKQQYSQFQNALQRTSVLPKANMAFTPMASACIEENVILNFFGKHKVHVNFYEMEYDRIADALLEGSLDFAIIDHSFDSANFDSYTLKTTDLVLVCSPNGKYAEKDRITREQLNLATIVLADEKSGLYHCTKNAIAQKNIRLKNNVIIYANTVRWLVKQILAYDGIGFVFLDSVKPYLERNELKRIELLNFQGSQNLYLIYNRRAFLDEHLTAIIDDIKKV